MAIDYSKLSDEELEAIANDDYSKLSEATLRMLSGESPPAPAPAAQPAAPEKKPGFFSRKVPMRPDEYGERIGAGPEMGPSAREVVDVTKSAGLGVLGGIPRMGAGITSIAGETDTSRALREMEEKLRQRAPEKEVFEVAKYAPEVVPALGAAKAVSAIPMASRTAKQVSQAAGQAGVAAAVEPEERTEAAALAGGVGLIPATIRGFGALREKFNEAMTGGPPDVVRDQLARIAEQLGFKIEAGQVSRATPVSTAGAGDAAVANQEKANRWASAPTGESTDKVTGTFLNDRRNALGKVYDDIFQKRQFNVTGDSLRTLENVLDLEDSVSPAHVPAVKKLAQQILKNYDELVTNVQRTGTTTPSAPGGRQSYFFTVDGEGLQRIRNKLTTVASTATDKSAAREIYKMIDNLDQVVRDTDPKLYEKLRDTNTKYRATMTLKDLQDAKGIDAGDVSLERLGNLVKGDDYNPLFPIANIGEQLGIRAIWEPTVAGASRGAAQQAATLVKPGMGRIIFNRLARYPSSQAARNLQKKIIDAEATGGLGSISFTPEEIAILNPIVRSIEEDKPEKKAKGGVTYSPAEEGLLKKYSTGGPTSRPTLPGDRSTGYKQEGDEENRLKRFLEAAAMELPPAIKQSVTSNADLAAKYLKFKFGMMSPDEAMMAARALPESMKGMAAAAAQTVKNAPRAITEATPESAGRFTAQMLAGELTDPTRLGRAAKAVAKPVATKITEPEREFGDLWHGSPNPEFEKFDPNVRGEFTGRGALGPGYYLGEKGYAEGFAGRLPGYEPPPQASLTQWKPNIKKSLYFDDEGFTPNTPRANAANRKAFEAVKKVDPELAYRVFEFKGDRVAAIRAAKLAYDADGAPYRTQDDFVRAMDIAGIDSVVDLVPGKGIHQIMVRNPENLRRSNLPTENIADFNKAKKQKSIGEWSEKLSKSIENQASNRPEKDVARELLKSKNQNKLNEVFETMYNKGASEEEVARMNLFLRELQGELPEDAYQMIIEGPLWNKTADEFKKNIFKLASENMGVSKLPRVDEIERFNVGPASVKPRVIAENKPLFRETSALNVNDFLQNDRQFDYRAGFVTDDPALAIGQGANKGVLVQFRPNSVSGEIHQKPGAGVIGGFEYKADVFAPMAVERVTFKNPKKDFKNLAFRAKQNLSQNFSKVQNEDGSITFIRKMED